MSQIPFFSYDREIAQSPEGPRRTSFQESYAEKGHYSPSEISPQNRLAPSQVQIQQENVPPQPQPQPQLGV